MAKEKNAAEEQSAPTKEESLTQESTQAPQQKTSLITWLILLAVIVAGSTGGFALSQLVSGPIPPQVNAQEPESADTLMNDILASGQQGKSSWLFEDLEPVLANLDEPGVSRFVRVLVTLEVSPELDQEKGELFLEEKQVILRDWLTTYFAGLSLEDVRGSRNHTRIKEEIQEHFNQILFPSSRPLIKRVLFKEFAVQ